MIEFKEITLADKPWLKELLAASDYNFEEYSFSFNYMWKHPLSLTAGRIGDFVTIRSDMAKPGYLFPAGRGDLRQAIDALIDYSMQRGETLRFYTVPGEGAEMLERLYPGRFVFNQIRDYADYLYDAKSLITLSGKKLHSKRNHIARFNDNNPNWSYEPITRGNIDECYEMNEEWYRQADNTSRGLKMEYYAVETAFKHFFELGLDGGLIRAGGRVVAYAMGERINSDTYLVHIEKAFGDIQGSYAIINQQFALHAASDAAFINREDDMGQEGLRRAKLSYRPIAIVDKRSAQYCL